MKVDLLKDHHMSNNPAMWIICHAINENLDINSPVFHPDENKMWDIQLTCNGVELNFENVVHAIHKSFQFAVCSKASEIIQEKFQSIIDSCYDIQNRVDTMKEDFRRKWENEDN